MGCVGGVVEGFVRSAKDKITEIPIRPDCRNNWPQYLIRAGAVIKTRLSQTRSPEEPDGFEPTSLIVEWGALARSVASGWDRDRHTYTVSILNEKVDPIGDVEFATFIRNTVGMPSK